MLFLLVLMFVGSSMFCQNMPRTLKFSIEEVKKSSLTLDMKANKYDYLSDSCSRIEDYSSAIAFRLEGIRIYYQLNDLEQVTSCNEQLGILSYHLGDYNGSLQYYSNAIKFYDYQENNFSKAAVVVNIANVYTRLGEADQALFHMDVAEKIYLQDSLLFKRQLIALYTNMGLAYTAKPHMDSALVYYNKALNLIDLKKDSLYYAIITNNIGDIYIDRKEYDVAMEHYSEALEISKSLGYVQLIATAQLNIGRVNQKQGRYKKAINLFENALKNYSRIKNLFFITESHEKLGNTYKMMGNYRLAHHHLELYHYYDDSLRGNEILNKIADLEMKVVMEKEQQKLQLVEQKKELSENENRNKQIKLYFLICGIALTLIIVLLVNRTLKISLQKNKLQKQVLDHKQKQLQSELSFKQNEIENFTTYIQEKNKILNDVKVQLKKLKSSTTDSSGIGELMSIVEHNIYIDKDRKELELKIDQVHQEFLSRLKVMFPILSKTDLRLCSLLLLELSTKDISVIMNIESESVKRSRNRLRKKLNLDSNSNINKFLKEV